MRRIQLYFALLFAISLQSLFAQEKELHLQKVILPTEEGVFGARQFDSILVFIGKAIDSNILIDPSKELVEPFTDLYILNNERLELFKFRSDDGSMVHGSTMYYDGPISQSNNGKYIFFNLNVQGNYQESTMGVYYSIKGEKGYLEPIAFEYNSFEYSIVHPYFDDATSSLYFSSDMENENGDMDVFMSKFDGENFGNPIRLAFSTQANEVFPFVHNGVVYFSSDNDSLSIGGFDILSYTEGRLNHMNEPINSVYDDFAITWISDDEGYFSSNRIAEDGNLNVVDKSELKDDLYYFKYLIPSNELVNDFIAENNLKSESELDRLNKVDSLDQFNAPTTERHESDIVFEKNKPVDSLNHHVGQGLNISTYGTFDTIGSNVFTKEKVLIDKRKYWDSLKQENLIPLALINYDVYKDEVFSDIRYEFSSYELSLKSISGLSELVMLLKSNSELKVFLVAYTDCEGPITYNQKLSTNRAKSVQKYLINMGVHANQVYIKSGGESNLKSGCDCSNNQPSDCDRRMREVDRRTEILVLLKGKQ